MKQKESDLQKSILDLLRLKRFVAFKVPSVGTYNKKRDSYIPMSKKGISDIIACERRTGRLWAIEAKIKPNRASDEQLEFLNMIDRNGGVAILAYTLDDVIEKLN